MVVQGQVVTATPLSGRESVSGRVLAGAPVAVFGAAQAGYGQEMETYHNGLDTADATFEAGRPANTTTSRRRVYCALGAVLFVLIFALFATSEEDFRTYAADDDGSRPLTESAEVDVSGARGPDVVVESQPVRVPVPAVMQSQSVDLVLELSISDIDAEPGGRDAFETTFTESTAEALGVPRSRICCAELRGGSTVATFTLLVAPDPAAVTPLDLVTQLQIIASGNPGPTGGAAVLALLEMVDTTVPVTATAAPVTAEVMAALETRMQNDIAAQLGVDPADVVVSSTGTDGVVEVVVQATNADQIDRINGIIDVQLSDGSEWSVDDVARLPDPPRLVGVSTGAWTGDARRPDRCTYELFEDSDRGGRSVAAAEDVCVANGGHLASIHDRVTLQAVGGMVDAAGVRQGVWIGLHDQHIEASCDYTGFIWYDGTPNDYENWAAGEPNDWTPAGPNCDPTTEVAGGEDCVEQYVGSNTWNDVSCDAERAYICSSGCAAYVPPPPPPPPLPIATWTGGTYAYMRCTYELFDDASIGGRSVPSAEAVCVANGGHLAAIHDRATQDQLGDMLFASQIRSAWIGLHDQHIEAGCNETGFSWSDGSRTDWSSWAAGEPNDWSADAANCDPDPAVTVTAGGEDCVEIVAATPDLRATLVTQLPTAYDLEQRCPGEFGSCSGARDCPSELTAALANTDAFNTIAHLIEVGAVTSAALSDVEVTYTGLFVDPVIIAGTPSHNGDDEIVVRLRGDTDTAARSFSMYVDIPTGWGCGDHSDTHVDESFSYLLVEAGAYFTGGLEAGKGTYNLCSGGSLCTPELGCASCDHATGFDWLDVPFTIPIVGTPVVVSTHCMHPHHNLSDVNVSEICRLLVCLCLSDITDPDAHWRRLGENTPAGCHNDRLSGQAGGGRNGLGSQHRGIRLDCYLGWHERCRWPAVRGVGYTG